VKGHRPDSLLSLTSSPHSIASSSSMHQSYQRVIGAFDFNLKRHQYAQGSCSAPYPQARDVYVRSSLANPEDNFSDLYMNDLVNVGKCVARKKLHTLETTKFLTALLTCGSVVWVGDTPCLCLTDLRPRIDQMRWITSRFWLRLLVIPRWWVPR